MNGKYYKMTLLYSNTTRNCYILVNRKAELNLCDNFKLENINEFLNDIAEIYKDIHNCSKSGIEITVTLSVSTYNNGSQTNYDLWRYEGVAESDGIHLLPDTRYTEESHDMWLEFYFSGSTIVPCRDIFDDITA